MHTVLSTDLLLILNCQVCDLFLQLFILFHSFSKFSEGTHTKVTHVNSGVILYGSLHICANLPGLTCKRVVCTDSGDLGPTLFTTHTPSFSLSLSPVCHLLPTDNITCCLSLFLFITPYNTHTASAPSCTSNYDNVHTT